jgi:hypothetical protein
MQDDRDVKDQVKEVANETIDNFFGMLKTAADKLITLASNSTKSKAKKLFEEERKIKVRIKKGD